MITNGTFCYWDAKSDIDALILLFNMLTIIIIMGFAIYYANQFRKTNSLHVLSSKKIYYKFLGVVLWGLSYQASIVFSVLVYWVVYRGKNSKQVPQITEYSQVYALIETIPAMIVQTLLFTTAKEMISNGMGFLLNRDQQPTKSQRTVYTRIQKYSWIRLIFILAWLPIIFPYPDVNVYQILTQIKIVLLMLDCLIIVALLCYCHRYMLDKSGALLANNMPQRKKLHRQTTMLALCGVSRLLMDLTFYIIFPAIFANMQHNAQIKPCIQDAKDHLEFTIGYLVVATYLLHHVSVGTVLVIYKPGVGGRTSSEVFQEGEQQGKRNEEGEKIEDVVRTTDDIIV